MFNLLTLDKSLQQPEDTSCSFISKSSISSIDSENNIINDENLGGKFN